MSNPTELPDLDRIGALRAALSRISETRFGWDGDCGVTSIADDALSADDGFARGAKPEGEAPRAELIELLKAIRPSYGDMGSRDIDVATRRLRIDRAIELLRAPAATLSPLCGAQQAESGARVQRFTNNGDGVMLPNPDGVWCYYQDAIAAQSQGAQDDPLDWPIPCDLVDDAVTLRKGVKLRTVQARLKFLSALCRNNLSKAYRYDAEHPNDGLNASQQAAAPGALDDLPVVLCVARPWPTTDKATIFFDRDVTDDELLLVNAALRSRLNNPAAPANSPEIPDGSLINESTGAPGTPEAPKPTYMTDEQAERWAWEQVKLDVGTEGWTAGESCTYFGFFLWGWRYRAQYQCQRAAQLDGGQEGNESNG